MPKLYYFNIQLTEHSDWVTHIGYSLTHVMAYIGKFDQLPYAYRKGNAL